MDLYNINRGNVDRCIHNMAQAVAQGQYSTAEVSLAVAEFMGRMVVSLCETPVSGIQLAAVLEDHLKRTLQAGYSAKGFNMGPVEM